MDLREPPRSTPTAPADRVVRALLVLNLVAVVALAAYLLLRGEPTAGNPESAGRAREVASKLKAAGALDAASDLYARYLETGAAAADERAKVAYSLGTAYLDRGRADAALRWFYEAESLGGGGLDEELGRKIVHCLDRLGRPQAARAALGERTALPVDDVERAGDDPVVARIGPREVHLSDVERAIDDLPPELAQAFSDPARRKEFLRQYVADELLWQKARRLEIDRDPEVLRQEEAMRKRLAVSTYLEREVLGKITADEADLRTWYEAHRDRYRAAAEKGDEPRQLGFDEARSQIERDYRLFKAQSAYQQAIEREIAGADVEIFEEAWAHG